MLTFPCLKKFIPGAGIALLAAVFSAPAAAEFPHDRPIVFMGTFAPGGANGIMTRLMALHMGRSLKAETVPDAKVGANGMIGAGYVAKSAPDGYTLATANSATHGTNPTLYKKTQPYDAIKDFTPVAMLGVVPIVALVSGKLGVDNMKDFVALAKKRALSVGHSGVGGTAHLAAEEFAMITGARMTMVAYKGDIPALTDAMGGQVDVVFASVASVLPFLKNEGRLKVLASANPTRLSALPDVPTMAEAGFPGFRAASWYALMGPAGIPKDRVDILTQAARKTLEDPEVKKSMAEQSVEISYLGPEDLRKFYTGEIERFARLIEKLKLETN
jgi:tripartite-type tricarboxylate transporter receptor subunit TctC